MNLVVIVRSFASRISLFRYCPIIPTVLVNGSEGIGTGWSTRVPNHDIREVVENCRRLMRGEEPLPMVCNSWSGARPRLGKFRTRFDSGNILPPLEWEFAS